MSTFDGVFEVGFGNVPAFGKSEVAINRTTGGPVGDPPFQPPAEVVLEFGIRETAFPFAGPPDGILVEAWVSNPDEITFRARNLTGNGISIGLLSLRLIGDLSPNPLLV